MNYQEMARQQAAKFGIDPDLYVSLINQESRFNPNAVSPVGARGLAQIMPDTGRQPGFGVDPVNMESHEDQLRFGAEYLSTMMNRYGGNVNKALAAYNWGAGNADQWDGVNMSSLPSETRDYIAKITGTQPGGLTGVGQLAFSPQNGPPAEAPQQPAASPEEEAARKRAEQGAALLSFGAQAMENPAQPVLSTKSPPPVPSGIQMAALPPPGANPMGAPPGMAPGTDPTTGLPTPTYFPGSTIGEQPPVATTDALASPGSARVAPGLSRNAYDTNRGIVPEPALAQSNAGGGYSTGTPVPAPEVAQAALAEDSGQPPEQQSWMDRFLAKGPDGNWLTDRRADALLAIGTGLLSGDDWASGGAAAGTNLMGLRGEERAQEYDTAQQAQRQQDAIELRRIDNDAAMARTQAASASGSVYDRPFNIAGRDKSTGMEVVRPGRFENGEYMVKSPEGEWVSADTILDDVRLGGRNETQDVTAGAVNPVTNRPIPNATSVNEQGVPTFNFTRQSDGQAFSWGLRAITAEQNLTAMIDYYGPETFTSISAGLAQWGAQNARAEVTPAVLNSILDDAGVQGSARSVMSQYLQAILRSDTGAAYTGVEMADYASSYLPNTGDDAEAVANKRLFRMDAIRGITPRAGPAAPYLGALLDGTETVPGERWQPPAAEPGALDSSNAASADPAPDGVDPLDWQYMSEEDKALWR